MENSKPFFKLLKNVHVFAPEDKGIQDILIAGEKIAAIGKDLFLPPVYQCQVIEGNGLVAVPGFMDAHVHIIGGGGEGGFQTRTPEIQLSKITTAGVTTVFGLLGTDGITRHVESLLAKARGLENEGISTYIYSGSYEMPTPTITGSVRRDIVLIDKVIGTGEIAMSDHRSSQSPVSAYREITAEARVGGMLSGKAGVVNMHIGDGTDALKYLREITANGELPKTQVIPTHVNRNKHLFADAIDWAKSGGLMDFTSSIAPKDDDDPVVKTSKGIRQALDAGVPLRQISVSSDGNGSMPIFDDNGNNIGVGVANEDSLLKEFRDLVQEEGLSLSDALTVFTSNVAQNTKLYPKKGCLAEGSDADILLLDDKLQLNATFARGQQMVKDGKAIVFGTFEEH